MPEQTDLEQADNISDIKVVAYQSYDFFRKVDE